MDSEPLVSETIEAGESLVRRFNDYMPVKVAFWLKPSEKDSYYLYIASNEIDDTNFELAYAEVSRLTRDLESPFFNPFKVNVISGKDPLANAADEINVKFPDRIPVRYGGRMFGGMSIDGVYIYPPQVTTEHA